MANYDRPAGGFRFKFGGMKLNEVADAIPTDKYPVAVNVRAYSDESIVTRPGQALKFATDGRPITDLRAYTTLFTDNRPRYLARDNSDSIYLDTGTKVGLLSNGGFPYPGVAMIPFRPNNSPSPYMYIGSASDYKKYSAPDASNAVTQSEVGIQEPQTAPDAALFQLSQVQIAATGWAAGGTAGAVAGSDRVSDICGVCLLDPASVSLMSIQVASAESYQRQMAVIINSNQTKVEDVIPPLPTALNIQAVHYFSGAAGRCVIVPANLSAGPGTEEASVYSAALLASLRRGAIIQIGTEYCLVWSSTIGPDGSVAIETSTIITHTAADTLLSVPTITAIISPAVATPGASITAPSQTYQVTAGTGTQSVAVGFDPFLDVGVALQPDDYISIGILVDDLTAMTEMHVMFDVGDGSFTQNYYYYVVRPSDIAGFLAAQLTQLAAVQQIEQRAIIDALDPAAANNQLQSASSAQTSPGSSQWTQITFPISGLTRVGSDDSKTLNNINACQILWIASGTINVAQSEVLAFGTFQPDVGDIGAPYLYRVRPRSAVTGARGNPSPPTRYGVSPRRMNVRLLLPSAAYDAQIDTWDIFRYGGAITSWRYVGQTASTNSEFIDNFSDAAVQEGEALDFDNFEPWPTIDVPNNGTITTLCGTLAVLSNSNNDMIRYAPGTLIRIGTQNVYTFYARPRQLSPGTFLLQFIENAGAGTNLPYYIQEPILLNQHQPYLWGPDAAGTVFGVGDPFRPGTLSFAKNYAPDSAPDSYNIEITPPSEPLLGGEVIDGLSFVASTERWWALYPSPANPAQRYSRVQQTWQRGLAAPYGKCTDGREIFWWAKDGIWSSSRGSLTDADLYTLFPHEGVAGRPSTYAGVTIQPPDYSQAKAFRMAWANSYLYATYVDAAGAYHTLICNTRTGAWSLDNYTPQVTAFYHPEQQASSLLSNAVRYDELVMANASGQVAAQQSDTNDIGGPIPCALASLEYSGGDTRAGKQWGDLWLDSTPIAAGAALVVTPTSLHKAVSPAISIPQSTSRVQQPVSIGGGLLLDYLGNLFTWTDDFTHQTLATRLHIWQPSLINKPETIADRFTDWDDAGLSGAKWFQGFILHADTFNANKGLQVRDADTQQLHAFTPTVQQNGETEAAYSFNSPFIAHMVRVEPTDQVPWRLFKIRWVAEETPEVAETWQTQFTSHGMLGYMHIRQISVTYAASAPVTFTITSYDGTSPQAIIMPSTGGAVQKRSFAVTFNKGQLYAYKAQSAAPLQIYVEKSEVIIGQWGRGSEYSNRPLVGGVSGDNARI